MPTRYEQLRRAVRYLAAPATEQMAYLDRLLSPVAGGGSAAAYGNDELALSLDDLFFASDDMISHGELTEVEAAAIRPLDGLLTELSGEQNAPFWRREALVDDERWKEVRSLAGKALAQLPEEERPVDQSAGNAG